MIFFQQRCDIRSSILYALRGRLCDKLFVSFILSLSFCRSLQLPD
ncbi:hypothetical protein CLOSTMETH_02891 [[Clostridium] methylpentosum DSM 5476]|uniref:Uncharacterized protein n=1 Tax=[Clostridium] methylpentosum DSM 5476 TaxID=537013 RepID=C0EG98_9FIRM|nr:hypothetical protein CLOSTMETH_02891 [[Clostridium] methylpentosum DSM 5476]